MNFLSKTPLFLLILFICSCSSHSSKDYEHLPVEAKSKKSGSIGKRLIQKSGSMGLDVDSVKESTDEVYKIVDGFGGYVDSASNYSSESTFISVKVPSEKMDATMEAFSTIGTVTSERRSSRDVTEEVVDIEARLNNLIELRNRFRQLLSKAEKVDEILTIERELSRIQTEIDSIESRKKMLIGKVEQSKIDVTLNQNTVLGPIGYLVKGVYWGISKLFVIK